MKKKNIIIGLLVCAMATVLTACSDEDYLGGHYITDGAGTQMSVTAQISAATNPTLAWTEGDKIGVGTSYGQYDATARNREYVCQADGKTFVQATGHPIYVKGATDIVAYYPYAGPDGAEASIALDTRNQSAVKEYLFAKAEGVTPQNGSHVNLVFDYALAGLNLAVTVPAGEQINSYRLSGFAQQATVDPYTLDMTLEAPEDLTYAADDIRNISLRLIPQTIAADAAVPARLVLVGKIRSYSIDMSTVQLTAGAVAEQTVDVTTGVSNFEFVPASTTWQPSTITGSQASEPLLTTFQLGDQAGLYAVKGGQVIKENILLTYNANGFWEAAEPIEADGELTGAQFYAYYPYTASATFNAASSVPFAQMVAASTPGAKQNTKADYEAADLMVTAAATVGQYNAVQLPLQHQKAMVCIELPNSSYIFNNANMDPYVLTKAENAKFVLDGTGVQPFFDEASQTYRLVIEPGQASTLQVTYTTNGEEKSFETSALAQLQAGEYARFVVDGGASLVSMTLEVGDYYCADGRLVKKNATTLPDNIVGVVFKIGTTEAIRSANSSWSHAVVVSTAEVKAKWGNDKSTTSDQNNAGWKYWYRSYNLADQNGQTGAAKLDESLMAEEGFEVTKAWRAVPQPLTIGAYTLDYTSLMNETLDGWIETHPLAAQVNSGWYIPSLGDWHNIEGQSAVIAQQLAAAGATALSTAQYWSCNVRGAGSNWCYVLGKTSLADRYKGVACNSSVNYRFLLAF